jgi:tetratricopeptide (TPR) repeat protein
MHPYLSLTSREYRSSSKKTDRNNYSSYPFAKEEFNFSLTPSTALDTSEPKKRIPFIKIPAFQNMNGVDRKEKLRKKANYHLEQKINNPKLIKIRKNLTENESVLYSSQNNSSSNMISDIFIGPLILKNNSKYLRRSTCEEFLKSVSNPKANIRKSFLDIKCSLKKLNQTTKDNYEKYLDLKNYRLAKRIMANLRKIFEENLDRSLPILSLQEKIDEILKNMVDNLESLPELLKECIYYRDEKAKLIDLFTIITQKVFKTHDFFIYIESLKILGKIYRYFGEFNKSLQTYFQACALATKNELFKSKMKIHKRIGKIYLELQNRYKAKSHFIKGLHLAWFVNSEKYELEFYDFLGVIAYYDGDVEKAKFYHEKMVNSETEPKNSSIKLIAIRKIINKNELRKTKEISFNFNEGNVSSEEEEVGLYDMKKDVESNRFN